MAQIKHQYVLGADISSQVIAWFSAGHFSHVDCLLDEDFGPGLNGYLLGARSDWIGGKPPGVQVRPPAYDLWARRVVMTIGCSDRQKAAYYAFLRDQVGKPYDMEAILAFMADRNWRKADSWICSELQCAAGESSKILPPLYLAANKITPVSSALAFSAVGGTCG